MNFASLPGSPRHLAQEEGPRVWGQEARPSGHRVVGPLLHPQETVLGFLLSWEAQISSVC